MGSTIQTPKDYPTKIYMNKVRITAIRQTVYPDLMAKYENPMSAMISCNDGFRPFSFYIEVIE